MMMGVRKVPVRYVDFMTWEHIYQLHMAKPSTQQVSRTTLRRAWDSTWKHLIRIIPVRTHGRCAICAELDEFSRKAITEEERLKYQEDKANHIKDIKADREVATRGAAMSEDAVAHPSGDGYGQVLRMTIDGMDQAKFKLPRNIKASKPLQGA